MRQPRRRLVRRWERISPRTFLRLESDLCPDWLLERGHEQRIRSWTWIIPEEMGRERNRTIQIKRFAVGDARRIRTDSADFAARVNGMSLLAFLADDADANVAVVIGDLE